MLGELPISLTIGNEKKAIRSDFRVALTIMQAFSDMELNTDEKIIVMLECLYIDLPDDLTMAAQKATLFLDGLSEASMQDESLPVQTKRAMCWEQDEQMIFSAINKVAGCEVRALPYLHWWTFLGYFNEIGEGLFSTVINIRQKRNSGKKLEKHEQEFYRKHQGLIDLRAAYTADEQAELEQLNAVLGGVSE